MPRDTDAIRSRTQKRHHKVREDFNKYSKIKVRGLKPSVDSIIEKVAEINNLSISYTERILTKNKKLA
jgi:hypothetical protein